MARAGVLGGLSLILALVAHLVGGGSSPGAGVLLVAAVLLGLAAAVVTARRCRFRMLAPLLVLQQAFLHELFDLAGASASGCHLAAAGMAHGAVGVPGVSTCGTGMAMPMPMDQPGWSMWAAHLLATAATAWLLARGEAWLWRTVDRVGAAAGLRRSVAVTAPRWASALVPVVVRPLPRLSWAPAGPRGPPVVAAG